MRTLRDLSVNARAVLLLVMFFQILLLLTACAAVRARKRSGWDKLLFLLLAGDFAALVILSQAHKALIFGQQPVCQWVMDLPAVAIVLWLLELTLIPSLMLIRGYPMWKNEITRFSIKESMDQLPMGLCFSHTNGVILLANRSMNALCHQIVGRDLQDAERLWAAISGREPLHNAERVFVKGEQVLRFPDGTVRAFRRETILIEGTPIVQITAVDITEPFSLTEKLQVQNAALDEMNARLRRYGENVEELVRKQEWLDTKVRIHGEFGQALLAARRFLAQPDAEKADPGPLLSQWSKNIAILRQGTSSNDEEHTLEELYEAAQSVGIRITLDGRFPDGREEKCLLVSAAAEALTNVVKHADASELTIRIQETEQEYIARFTNDGRKPSGPITEGGGLGSLRKKIERAGGTMETAIAPEFALIVKLPKKGGDFL